MDDPTFDEAGDELKIARQEFEKNLKSIETTAFHDGYEESSGNVTQKAFDIGYKLIFPYISILAKLEAAFDVLTGQVGELSVSKEEFAPLYQQLYGDFETKVAKDITDKSCLKPEYSGKHIGPNLATVDKFNDIKQRLVDACEQTNLAEQIKQLSL